MSEWKTIESAPKDGTPVLVHRVGETPFPNPIVVKWDERAWMWRLTYSESRIREPTHWAPLPSSDPTP
jgi:hypothetical protein